MKKPQYSEEQVAYALREAEGGMSVAWAKDVGAHVHRFAGGKCII